MKKDLRPWIEKLAKHLFIELVKNILSVKRPLAVWALALTAGLSAQAQFTATLPPYALSDLGTSTTLGPPQVSSTNGLTYQWYLSGNLIALATNAAYATPTNLSSGSYNYSLIISSNAAPLATNQTTLVNGASLFDSPGMWTINKNNAVFVTPPFITNNVLQLTDNQGSEGSSAFYNAPGQVPIAGFTAACTYRDVTTGGADGWSFCLQNDARGLTALGGGGGNIGVVGISPSAEFDFDIYGGNAPLGGNNGGYSFRINGAGAGPYSSNAPIVLAGGHPINVFVTYDQNTFNLQLTLIDPINSGVFATNFNAGDLTSVVGSGAYLGFTAGTGGAQATQVISNFVFLYTSPFVAITVPPTNMSASVGQPITFAVAASGSPPLTYQWQFMGTNIPGAVHPSYSIPQAQLANAGTYTIIVGSLNATNTATTNATLTVSPNVNATLQPASSSIFAGLSQTFTVSAYGSLPLTYQWFTNSVAVAGAISSTYTTPNNLALGSYTISVAVSNNVPSSEQPTASLTVVAASPFVQGALQFNPLSYWPLDEPASAVVAHDYVGGNNGTYTNVTTGDPGPPQPLLGGGTSASFSGPSGNGYVNIPLNNLDIRGSLTMFAWIQSPTLVPNFETFFGHSDNSYRMDVDTGGLPHFADNPAGDAIGPNSIADGNWHMITGVYNSTNGNRTLYVDGAFAANANGSGTPAGSPLNVIIGGDPQYIPSRLFSGSIAQAAIYANALNSNQVRQLYVNAGIAPTASLPVSQFYGDLNGSVSLTATVVGTPPVSLQWYYFDLSSVVHSAPDQTNTTLTLNNLSSSQNGFMYFLVATNVYGSSSNFSAQFPATLNVESGPPSIQTDISPTTVITTIGTPESFSFGVFGTAPISYQWYQNSLPLTGATNASYSFFAKGASNNFYVVATNTSGSATSMIANVFGSIVFYDGTGWTLNTSGSFPTTTPHVGNDTFFMTDGNNGEGVSGWFSSKVPINVFQASFTFNVPNGTTPPADGMCFALQNSAVNARGGGGFAISGVQPSVEWDLNLYPGNNGGVGISFERNGISGTPTPPAPIVTTTAGPWPINHPVNITIAYDRRTGIATETLVDTITGGTFSTNWPAGDVPATLGGSTAWVGFAASTGGLNATMIVSNFTFNTIPVLGVAHTGPNTYAIQWTPPAPPAVSNFFVLQQASAVTGGWANVSAPLSVLNGIDTVNVTNTATAQYYRLRTQ